MDLRYGFEGKRTPREKMIAKDDSIPEEEVEDDAEEEEGGGVGFADDDQKRKVVHGKRGSGGGGGCGGVSPPSCQVERCGTDLTEAKRYHRRHKVCEIHAKAPAVVVAGLQQRFCQQCSRFHELSEFDEAKRSCRRRLAGHNERRRKSTVESYGESSGRKGNGHQMKESQCRQIDDKGRLIQMNLQGNPSYTKRSQIR